MSYPEMNVSQGIDQPKVEKRKGLIEEIEDLKKEGKSGTPEFTDKMRELEGVLGVSQVNPFGTNEVDILQQNLDAMNNADMQALAIRVGISPNYERPMLKTVLIKEFKATNRNNMRNVMPGTVDSFVLDPDNPKHAETIKILGEF